MTIFSKIVKGEIPAYKVAEDDKHLAFLDINPLTKGHTLVIPKKETDYIFDLNSQDFNDLQLFSRKVALAIKDVIDCKRIGTAVIGFEVPHVHIHLIPVNTMSDFNFANPKLEPGKEEMSRIAALIKDAFKNQQ